MPADPRLVAQIKLILENHPDAAVFPENWEETGEVDYLYRKTALLSNTQDLESVLGALERFVRGREQNPLPSPRAAEDKGSSHFPVSRVSAGVSRIDVSQAGLAVPELLDGLERQEGLKPGLAAPDHVLYVCPYPCPATEPVEVPPHTTRPFPSPPAGGDGNGVSVLVADTGFLPGADTEHSWLAGVTGDTEDPYDPVTHHILTYAGHGTFVAGCLRTMAPKAQVFVKKIFEIGAERFESDLLPDLEATLDSRRGTDVLVLTFTTSSRGDRPLKTFDDFRLWLQENLPDLAVLAPAGNDGKSRVMWPAAYDWVTSVGALSPSWEERAYFSNYGDWVKVYTPGENLVNAYATGVYVCNEPPVGAERRFHGMAVWSGTSFSTPVMAGMIAAQMSAGTMENGQQAADKLCQQAEGQAADGIGPVLYPDPNFVPDSPAS